MNKKLKRGNHVMVMFKSKKETQKGNKKIELYNLGSNMNEKLSTLLISDKLHHGT